MLIQTISDWGELWRDRDCFTATEGQVQPWPEQHSGWHLHWAGFSQESVVYAQKSFVLAGNIHLDWGSGCDKSSELQLQAIPAVVFSPVKIYLLILSSSCSSEVCKDVINGVRFTEIEGNLGKKEA